jgi:dTDP-4-dehydrorhamnose reductase
MRYLLTGGHGMLGRDLQSALRGRDTSAFGHNELDITNLNAVRNAVAGHDVIINSAAYTHVDDAEAHEETAYAVNATGAHNLAIACEAVGARLIQISTDYVFNGKTQHPYAEDTPLSPLSVYGRTKAEGELLANKAHPHGTYIVRTAWLYGAHGRNFANTMLRLAHTNPTIPVANDQNGQPTWTADLAKHILLLIDKNAPPGIYHATNSGNATRFQFARAIFSDMGIDPERIQPTTSDTFNRPAPRPTYSVLGHQSWAKVGLPAMRPWRKALRDACAQGALKG